MKRARRLMIAVLLLSLALCRASMALLDGAVDGAQALRGQASRAAEAGRREEALALMGRLRKDWTDRAGLLEMVSSHDALHEVETAVAEAEICLRCDDHDDFLRQMAVLDGALEHIRAAEALSWSNLY